MMHIRHSHKTSYTITQNEKVWTVQETTEEKDLGVICTTDLKVSRQCCEAASKANGILGMVSRQFKNLDKKGFLILYKGFVRPHLEYNGYCMKKFTSLSLYVYQVNHIKSL